MASTPPVGSILGAERHMAGRRRRALRPGAQRGAAPQGTRHAPAPAGEAVATAGRAATANSRDRLKLKLGAAKRAGLEPGRPPRARDRRGTGQRLLSACGTGYAGSAAASLREADPPPIDSIQGTDRRRRRRLLFPRCKASPRRHHRGVPTIQMVDVHLTHRRPAFLPSPTLTLPQQSRRGADLWGSSNINGLASRRQRRSRRTAPASGRSGNSSVPLPSLRASPLAPRVRTSGPGLAGEEIHPPAPG